MFGPSARIESRSDSSKPRISDVIPTIDVMPMTTPSTVNAERILLVRSVSNAMRDDFARTDRLANLPRPTRASALRSDRARRAHRRIQAEEQPDRAR